MKLVKWLDKNFELLILAIMLAVMCVLSFANVIMRYAFHHALTWSDEVCCYLLALSAFFSLPCAIRRGVSLKVDTFTQMLSPALQKAIGLIGDLLMIVILGYLFKGTLDLIGKSAMIHQASPALRIPVASIYRLMALGLFLGILRYVQLVYRVLTGRALVESDNGNDLDHEKEGMD
jgi:TRAP-type C4-dicarboxylate transport system permease small subunit